MNLPKKNHQFFYIVLINTLKEVWVLWEKAVNRHFQHVTAYFLKVVFFYRLDCFVKFITPEFRGLRLGRRLYEYRKELCEKLNLKSILFGGRIPNYYKHADVLNPKEYIKKVRSKEIHDPVLDFQMSNDFHPIKVIKGYTRCKRRGYIYEYGSLKTKGFESTLLYFSRWLFDV